MSNESQPAKITKDPNHWTPGKYRAKAIDWACTKTAENLPQVTVLFGYEQPGKMPGTVEPRQLMWFGSFKGGALERTIESLFALGLRQAPYPAMESGHNGKALDINAEVEIVVEHRANTKTGEIRAGIQWVNSLDRGMMKKLDGNEAASMFAPVNDQFAAYLAGRGVTPSAPQASTGAVANSGPMPGMGVMEQPRFTENDIPF